MTPAQEKELADLTAAVVSANQDVTAKTQLAADKDAEAAATRKAADQAVKDASAAKDTLEADLKKLKSYVDNILDPVTPVFKPGSPETRK